MFTEPTIKCRVFISRKTEDRNVGERIRKALLDWAPNLEIFDAEDIEPGEDWLVRLRKELKRANILLLLLTKPARDDFDWPLYEAGLFESLDEEDRRRVVCVYADPGETSSSKHRARAQLPSQLGNTQAVKATEPEILKLLVRLFRDRKFTLTVEPLNPRLSEERLRPIARAIADDINRVRSERVSHIEYNNKYIQLDLPPDVNALERSTGIESEKESLRRLFGLRKNPVHGQLWTWGEIADKVVNKHDPAGFNRRWTKQLEGIVSALKTGNDAQQLTGRFLAADGKLYRPEIEVYRIYENDRMTIDVTFSEQVQDSWLRTARAPVALAANLALASRVRHELIEPYLRRVPRWRTETAMEDGCAELSQLVEDIEHDGYFIAQLTKNQLQEAFDETESDELGELNHQYGTKIRPFLDKALVDKEISQLRQVLKSWKRNNLRFLDIGLHRYSQMLGLPESPRPCTAGNIGATLDRQHG